MYDQTHLDTSNRVRKPSANITLRSHILINHNCDVSPVRGTLPTAPDSSCSATRHIPVTDCQPVGIQAGLWQRRTGRPSGLRRHQLPTTPFQSMELTSTQRSQSATWVPIFMPTWSCGHTSNVRYRDVSLHSVNCARSAVQCHQTHSSH